MRQCLSCGERPPELANNLCEECAATLAGTTPLSPEQIISSFTARGPAALLDQWGRPHYLDKVVSLGRRIGVEGIAILDSSISRDHATINAEEGTWTIRDSGSTNGTVIGDSQIKEPHVLKNGEQVTVGSVGFYFIMPTDEVADLDKQLSGETFRPEAAVQAIQGSSKNFGEESTFVGLPKVPVALVEPTGGGGGFIKALGKTIQLTTTQFEFVALLANRMASEDHQPDLVRGFVRSSELLSEISWDTAHPADNHVKQLVRRVRRALVRGGIGNLIESRHRFGYRFRIIPEFNTPKTS